MIMQAVRYHSISLQSQALPRKSPKILVLPTKKSQSHLSLLKQCRKRLRYQRMPFDAEIERKSCSLMRRK